ncbi:MAG: hypothetical protein JEZ07_11590 [Phycisphaerae bacterium]|nr:hypothetical protein [Phycisphaerae bacterium]
MIYSKKKAIKLILITLLVLLILYCLISINVFGPILGKAIPVFEDGKLSFKVNYATMDGFDSLIITDALNGEIIWHIKLASYYGNSLEYGEIPQDFKTKNGATNNAKQIFPKTGMPSDLVEGRIYEIYTDWQYDRFISACAGHRTQYFRIQKGKVVMVKALPNSLE